jgi:hypothetical protein
MFRFLFRAAVVVAVVGFLATTAAGRYVFDLLLGPAVDGWKSLPAVIAADARGWLPWL